MPRPTPFHPRTAALCTSYRWKEWAGYYAVCSYDTVIDREYFAVRHAAGLLDVSPLYKIEVTGRDAGRFLSRVLSKDVSGLGVGRATYLCWCDERGHVLDDGTVHRLGEQHYRLTASEPWMAWFGRFTRGYDVQLEDSSKKLAALALQGPLAREILKQGADAATLDKMKFFGVKAMKFSGLDVWISRTGYTGDLGYEIWVDAEQAVPLWDRVMAAGADYGIEPMGLDALDVTRMEAGFILQGVDYFSARTCIIDSRKSNPYEIGLGWTVELDRAPFVGQEALRGAEKASTWATVGLEVSWAELEALYDRWRLPPELPVGAWRTGVPLYAQDGRQIGQATSGAWSPTLKKPLALGCVRAEHAAIGQKLNIEHTVEYERHRVAATVVPRPFYDPPRKKALGPSANMQSKNAKGANP